MKASIDRDGCIGCGLCASTCPAVFEMDDENLAKVICEEIPAGEEPVAEDAMNNCPVSVITVE